MGRAKNSSEPRGSIHAVCDRWVLESKQQINPCRQNTLVKGMPFTVNGIAWTPSRALARQALLPVSGIETLTLLFGIEMHMGRYRTDENIRFS
jgi:hypothetical protein